MTDPKKKIVDALVEVTARHKIEAEARLLAEKEQAITRANEEIYSEIGRWTGIAVGPDGYIPIIRNGKQVGTLPQTILTGSPVEKVTAASRIEHKSEIERKISALQSVIVSSAGLIEALGNMTYLDRAGLEARRWWARNSLRGEGAPLDERLLQEIGWVNSAAIAARALSTTAETQLGELQEELTKREVKPGRPRNEAAHAVARELALLYAKITGKRPTYAEGADGLSGDYTPALRNVFDALGWKKTGLRGPAQAAIEAVTEADLKYEEIKPLGLFSTVWPE